MATTTSNAPALQPPHRNSRRPTRVGANLAVLALAATLVVLGLTWKPLRDQILLSVRQKPAPYTELYFTSYPSLPHQVLRGTTYPISYTVVGHNSGSPDVVVSGRAEANGHEFSIGEQTVRFGAGGVGTGTLYFTPPVRAVIYYVVVSLPNGQSIQWRVPSP